MARPVSQMPIRDSEYRERHPLQARFLNEAAQLNDLADVLDLTAAHLRTRATCIGALSEQTRVSTKKTGEPQERLPVESLTA